MAAAPSSSWARSWQRTHLGGAAAWGLILTGGGIGGVIGGVLALRLRPRRPLLTGFMIMAAVSLPPLALVGPLPVLLIAGASMLSLISIELANTWWYTMLQQHVPEHARSRVSSYDWLVSLVFQPLGFLLAGPLAARDRVDGDSGRGSGDRAARQLRGAAGAGGARRALGGGCRSASGLASRQRLQNRQVLGRPIGSRAG